MNRRNFLKLGALLTGIPAVVAGMLKAVSPGKGLPVQPRETFLTVPEWDAATPKKRLSGKYVGEPYALMDELFERCS